MAGGTTGFNIIQSSTDNRSIMSQRVGMEENPYAAKTPPLENRNPDNNTELINERFIRNEQHAQSNKFVLMFFGLLVLLSVSLFFI
jgi:hypothetical protein